MELCHEWTANLDSQPIGPPTLRVDGTVCFSTAGWRVELVKSVPQGINPRDLLLDVKVSETGSAHLEVLTEIPVRVELPAEPGSLDTVTIRTEEASGRTIEVTETS